MEDNKNKELVKINRIEPQVVKLFSPDGTFMGLINEYEFNDIRIQIKRNKLEGYYCVFDDKRFNINKDGKSVDWFEGFFDLIENQFAELFKLHRDISNA